MYVIILCVAVAALLLFLVAQHYMMRQQVYVNEEAFQIVVFDAAQDARHAAAYKNDGIMYAVDRIASATSGLRTLMKIYDAERVSEMLGEDVTKLLNRLEQQKEKIHRHAHELVPAIAPQTNTMPELLQSYDHAESKPVPPPPRSVLASIAEQVDPDALGMNDTAFDDADEDSRFSDDDDEEEEDGESTLSTDLYFE